MGSGRSALAPEEGLLGAAIVRNGARHVRAIATILPVCTGTFTAGRR